MTDHHFAEVRWPDTIYLHIGRLFSIQIFDHSAAFDGGDILDVDGASRESVYQSRFYFPSSLLRARFR